MFSFFVSDTPSLAAQLLDVQNGKKSDESKESTCQIGLELVDVIENISVGNTGNSLTVTHQKEKVLSKNSRYVYMLYFAPRRESM